MLLRSRTPRGVPSFWSASDKDFAHHLAGNTAAPIRLEPFTESEGVHIIRAPRHAGLLSPIVHAIPVQLLAYHAALMKGTDVDKPRNLAKSVTVE